MLALSLLCFAVAVYLAVEPLRERFEERLRRIEWERVTTVERGFWREFLFLEPELLRRNLRRIVLAGLLLSCLLASPWPLLLAALFVGIVPAAALRIVRERRKRRLGRQLAHVLPAISASLRAGHTFERAAELLARTECAPIAQEFELMLKEIRLGATLEGALENLAARCPLRDLELMARAVVISARAGSNLSEAFDRVAETVRARAALRDRVSALTAQGKLQAFVAIALPALLVPALQLIDPGYLAPLFQTGVGRLLLCLGALALAVGGFWVRRISRTEFLQ